MKKIPTLFERDPDNRGRVIDDVNPACRWVVDGEGVATRKFDGTCMMLDEDYVWWARREVKPGKSEPPNFILEDLDETTGKAFGWEPAAQSPFCKFWYEALDAAPPREPGTYELCGPKINGNPERQAHHVLIKHGDYLLSAPRTFTEIRAYLLKHPTYEGVVWWHRDGRRAKIKTKDFR